MPNIYTELEVISRGPFEGRCCINRSLWQECNKKIKSFTRFSCILPLASRSVLSNGVAMRNFIAGALSLLISASSFTHMIALGPKSSFLHAPKLEMLELLDYAPFVGECGHLLWYPNDTFATNKKLIIGKSSNLSGSDELLFVIENSKDIDQNVGGWEFYLRYYLIDADII